MVRFHRVTFPRNHTEVSTTAATATGSHVAAAAQLATAAGRDTAAVLTELGSRADGLTTDEVARGLHRFGRNEVSHVKPPTVLRLVATSVRTPFVLLLIALGVVLLVTGDVASAATIAGMVTIAVGLQVWQQSRANRAAQALKKLVVAQTTVRRRAATGAATTTTIPATGIVPGDVIELKAGDLVPADLRVLTARDLTLSQSALTGESAPQDKTADAQDTTPEGVLRSRNLCFMGTSVLSGTGTAVVIATGSSTYFGAMARTIETATGQSTYDTSIRQVSLLLVRLMLVLAPLVFLFNGLHTGDWVGAAFFAVAIAVGLTPSMLPTIVSVNLAKGAGFMAGKKVIVKVPDAIQNLGAMTLLCTDKTGTLTEDRIALQRHLDIRGNDSEIALFAAFLNSEHQTGVRNTLDDAIIASFGAKRAAALQGTYRVVDEIPFDFDRRRLSVVLDRLPDAATARIGSELHNVFPTGHMLGPDEDLIVTKGAVNETTAACTHVLLDGAVVALDGEHRAALTKTVADQNAQGMRVIAVAVRIVPAEVARARLVDSRYAYGIVDEADMTLVGLLTFLDPPKSSAAGAIADLARNGVPVTVISGDSALVTRHVVSAVGLWGDAPESTWDARSLTGAQVAALDDAALAARVRDVRVFAEMSPLQKGRVIQAFQHGGAVVGYLGDGINDAPALRQADIGISVNDGVDIAKDTADVILMEQDLRVLQTGVIEGRRTFGNIQKYLKMTVASNFGNVISVLVASIVIPFIPMLAIQILVQNMLYDLCQTAIPWDNVDEEFLRTPKRWSAGNLPRFMLWLGPVSSVFDIVAFAVMWFVFGWRGFSADGSADMASQHLFQTGWFVVGLITQVLVMHMVRTEKIPFVQSRPARPVVIASILAVMIAVWLPYSPLAAGLAFEPLPAAYFGWLVGIVVAYCLATQLAKVVYIRRYREWL